VDCLPNDVSVPVVNLGLYGIAFGNALRRRFTYYPGLCFGIVTHSHRCSGFLSDKGSGDWVTQLRSILSWFALLRTERRSHRLQDGSSYHVGDSRTNSTASCPSR